jgi:phosphoglycerate-specific signal transduction histidine kinase
MRQQRIAAATKVASELFAAETAVDQALASLARLQATLPQARSTANLSAVVGHNIVAQIAQSMSTIVEIRGEIVDVHSKLDSLKTDIGLREMAMGGLMLKPVNHANVAPELRVANG